MGLVPVQGTWKAGSAGNYILTCNGVTQIWDYASEQDVMYEDDHKDTVYSRLKE